MTTHFCYGMFGLTGTLTRSVCAVALTVERKGIVTEGNETEVLILDEVIAMYFKTGNDEALRAEKQRIVGLTPTQLRREKVKLDHGKITAATVDSDEEREMLLTQLDAKRRGFRQ